MKSFPGRMMIMKTLNELEEYVAKGLNACVVNPCGSGKTAVMAAFINNHKDKSFIIFTKQKNAGGYYKKRNVIFNLPNISIKTYSKMFRDQSYNELDDYKADFYLFDEAHYIGANKWEEAFFTISKKYHPILIGFTATPQRYEDQGTDNSIVKDYFDGNIAGNYTSRQLQQQGVFIEPEYILSIYGLDKKIVEKNERIMYSDLTETEKEKAYDKLLEVLSLWQTYHHPRNIMAKKLPEYMYKNKCNRILIYTANLLDLPEKRRDIDKWIAEIFPDKTIKSYEYTYKNTESELSDFLKEDKNDIKVLYSIDKIMETIHIDDLNIVIMLRPSVSHRIITQQFGRINNINNKNRSLIIDMYDNLRN